jgi:hypothetical protein
MPVGAKERNAHHDATAGVRHELPGLEVSDAG